MGQYVFLDECGVTTDLRRGGMAELVELLMRFDSRLVKMASGGELPED